MHFGSEEELKAFKYYIISLLVQQAKSDEDFSRIEKRYLKYAGDQLKVSDVELARIRSNPAAYTIAPPPDEHKRVMILYYTLFMMKADQKITKEEEILCYRIGTRLGFRDEMIENLINVMRNYLNQNLPPDAMLNEIKPFLN